MTTRPKAIHSDDISLLRAAYPHLEQWPSLAIETAWSKYSKALCCQEWLAPESAMPDNGFLEFCSSKRAQYPKKASLREQQPNSVDWM